MSLVTPTQCSKLRVKGYVLLQGRPCRISAMTIAKNGKHGKAKAHLTGVDVFTHKKYTELSTSTSHMDVPRVVKSEQRVVRLIRAGDAELGAVELSDATKLTLPAGCRHQWELSEAISTAVTQGEEVWVTIVATMGEEQVADYRCGR
eukprot:TRINITY_DN1305_c0_g1_i1.p1 TRINITY_DN1305_c0_g1~~TRINITY_DN1305_c0_g1_i1.p1  ORF type:complete len:160 (-),score=16.87 TRINITY_DN1305_c0_g1_i1:81-521(-)